MAERDRRFGGNMERANTGIPYPTGGRDVRFEGSLPHKFQYRDQGRTVVSDTEPYYTDMGRNRNVPQLKKPQSFTNLDMLGRPDLSFKYSHMNPDLKFGPWDDESIRGTWRRTNDARRVDEMDEYGYLEGSPRQRTTFSEGYIPPRAFNEMHGGGYEDRIMRGMGGGLGSLQEQAAVDPSDWRTILRILEAGGDPGTETAGIGSTNEYQMAELTQDQMNMMGNPLNTPDFGVSKEDLFDRVKGMEDKGFFGWGAQEPTTQEEYDDYYNKLLQGEVGNWVT